MSALQTFMLVADHDKQEAIRIAEKTAQEVESKQTTLIEVVQSLGEYINDEDPIIRGKAVSYLTAVIKALPPKFLSRQQIQVLTTFFCDRIEDGGAVTGLETLQKLDRFTKELAKDTARAIFEHFQELQMRPQSQRYQVYQLLNELMANHRADLMTGEKDPRNLMVVFSILKVVMVEWDISNHVETLFDSVYNYFPITFRPPPNDPYGITAQDLKDRLQDCISSTALFAPHAFPALLDKLDSTSPNVKKDALNALLACVTSYDPNTVSRYSIKIWDALKFEILNAQEEFLSELSLQVLQNISKRLSAHVTQVSQELPLAHFLRPIIKECKEQLREPQQKQAQPARQILRSVSAASAPSFILIIQAVVAPLFTVYQEADSIAKQRALLETLLALFDSAIELYGTWTSRSPEIAFDNPLLAFQDQLMEVFSQALMGTAKEENSFRMTALQGLLRLSTLRQFFQDNEIGLFVQYLDEILLKEETVGAGDLKKEAISALAEISKHKPRLIMEITLPAFMAKLPDRDDGENRAYLTTLETLAQISVEKDIFETLVRRLLNKLDLLLQNEGACTPAYPRAILLTILYAMEKRAADPNQSLESYYDRIVVGLCRRAAVASAEDKSTVLRDVSVLDTLGRLCNLIVRSISRDKQDEVADNMYSLFSGADSFKPVPFAQTTTVHQRRTMILSTYLLAGLPKDSTRLPYAKPDMSPLLNDLVKLSIAESEPAIQLAILRHLALMVNKFLPTTGLLLASEIFNSLLPPHSEDAKLTPETIKTLFWLSKALILRLAPSTTDILSSLLSLLSSSDKVTSETSARGFAIILSSDGVLSTQNGANIRLLSKQRVFSTVVPIISSKIREVNTAGGGDSSPSPPHIKPAYLTALSGVLSAIPPSLVMPELPTLLPLLLQSLDLEDAGSQAVKAATLQTLSVIIRDNGVGVIDESGHVNDLVRRLLKTATYVPGPAKVETTPAAPAPAAVPGTRNSAKLREQALRCLYLLAVSSQQPTDPASTKSGGKLSPLLPVKSHVLRSLRPILDDPKRDVRKAAVDARGAWLRKVSDAPDEDDD
ncbi:DNA repair/transcription protein [Rasamsonia emersonii CBS 393.64]|uniref:MMS19 nucleotide excision repair protein n=1 Tax=Rasamsonia emersonii (strain ATCC 16479 / CBS 393.64 / IMI 116815) TaxID=1408163 RepID=A0A0F4YLG7_RASE3|nr:DNA repair/transcription protein [Rasamsonia emersonii CBS 393.64]KKA19117.1 DNA repair/transcription protein [Rasamsonia emersonii CBS 393.64]